MECIVGQRESIAFPSPLLRAAERRQLLGGYPVVCQHGMQEHGALPHPHRRNCQQPGWSCCPSPPSRPTSQSFNCCLQSWDCQGCLWAVWLFTWSCRLPPLLRFLGLHFRGLLFANNAPGAPIRGGFLQQAEDRHSDPAGGGNCLFPTVQGLCNGRRAFAGTLAKWTARWCNEKARK